MATFKNIVLRMPNWLGDTVMALQTIVALRRQYASARIVVLCKAPLSQLFLHCPFVDEVYDLDLTHRFCIKFSNKRSTLKWLKEQKFCLAILYTNSFSSALLFKRAGIKKIIGYKRFLSSLLLSTSICRQKKGSLHMSECYWRLTDLVQVPRTSYQKVISFFPTEIESFDASFKLASEFIVLCPTSAFGPAKCWPLDRFVALAKRLVETGKTVVIAADKKLMFGYEHPNMINLSGKTTLRQFLLLLQKSSAVVANDSGPLHLSSHLRRPLVCLFGSSPVEQAKPYTGASIHYKNASCSPCFKKVCPIDFHCMKQISVDEVFDSTLYQLNRKKKVAVTILAGGKGQRLGSKTPKALVDFKGTTLLAHHLKQVPKMCPVFILTSPFTHVPIQEYLKKHNHFNRQITLYSKKALACTNLDGSPSDELAPEGNGAFYDSIIKSGFFQKHTQVEVVNCIPIDNPMAKPFCDDLIQACLEQNHDAAFSCIKTQAGQKVGLLVKKDKGLSVIEYMDPSVDTFFEKGHNLGFLNLFCLKKEFIFRASKKEFEWKRVDRGAKFHFERWIFDPFDLINSYKIFIRDKKNYFLPLKCKDDLEKVGLVVYNRHKENVGV